MINKSSIPNYLSISRGVMSLGIGALALVQAPLWIGSSLLVLGIITDKLDGSLARWWKVESETGKKLESVVDPLFLVMTIAYAVRWHALPWWFVSIGAILFLIISGWRSWVSTTSGQFFYKKSPLTRYGVGGSYLLMILYVFELPGRQIWLWCMLVVGLAMTINYGRLLWDASHSHNKRTPKPEAPSGA